MDAGPALELSVLGDAVTAAASASTLADVPRRLADAFAGRVEIIGVELVLVERDDDGLALARVVRRRGDRWDMREERRALKGSPAGRALATGEVVFTDGAQRRRGVAVPLGAGERANAALVVWFGSEAAARRLARPAFWTCLGRVLEPVLRVREVVRRVAALSRRAHVDNRELRGRLARLEAHLEGTRAPAARSRVMQQVLERADRVAGFDTTVLLVGESGTGKEVLARWLHERSSRASRPFLQVNCGALPGTLVESALFGHERGAFTGASRTHRGLFERAHRGTLLLDEVAELPLSAQVKLLRVLQEGTFERVGGERALAVDVRVVAATHRRLESLVRSGAFREDLYYRLAVFPIELPPLRARLDDLPSLVSELLETLCRRMGRPAPGVTPGVLTRLRGHPWPGNVRELRNVLEEALVLTSGPTLMLPASFGAARRRVDAGGRARAREDIEETFEQIVRGAIERALAACGGKIYGPGGAAERLELHPGTLQSKMRKLGIERQAFVRRPRRA